MIDIENIIVDEIATLLEPLYPGITVSSEDAEYVETFPFVSVYVENNTRHLPSRELQDNIERYVNITLNVNVYDNTETIKRSRVKEIFSVIDQYLTDKYFTRVMASPLPNIDRTVARFGGRYAATVGAPVETVIDGNTTYTYPVYRSF